MFLDGNESRAGAAALTLEAKVHRWLPVAVLGLVALAGCGGVGSRATTPTNDPPSDSAYLFATHGTDANISAFKLDPGTGQLTEVTGSPFQATQTSVRQALCLSGRSCDDVPKPLVADPAGKFLYVLDPDQDGVRAYQVDNNTGALRAISSLEYDTGDQPQDIRIDTGGKFLYVDSLIPAGITAFSIDAATGALRSVTGSPFATSEMPFFMTASSCCLYVASVDQPGGLLGYRIDPATGALREITGSPFASGRSMMAAATNPNNTQVVALEVGLNTQISTLQVDTATGALSSVVSSAPVAANPSMLVVSPQNFIYVSTGDGIQGFTLNATTGQLAVIPGVQLASGSGTLSLDSSGKYLFAVDTASNTIVTFAIDAASGSLTQVSQTAAGQVDYVNLAFAD